MQACNHCQMSLSQSGGALNGAIEPMHPRGCRISVTRQMFGLRHLLSTASKWRQKMSQTKSLRQRSVIYPTFMPALSMTKPRQYEYQADQTQFNPNPYNGSTRANRTIEPPSTLRNRYRPQKKIQNERAAKELCVIDGQFICIRIMKNK